jgi:hypothetical protein
MNTPSKTIQEYIYTLPLEASVISRIAEETAKDKGEEYLSKERTEMEMKDFAFCVLFVWNKTAEGFAYWVEINNTILRHRYGNQAL